MSSRDINDIPIPNQRYPLSINDLSRGYRFVLRIPDVHQWPSPGTSHAAFETGSAECSSQLNPPAKIQHTSQTVHKAQPDLLFLFFSLGSCARARRRRRASPAGTGGSGRGESTGQVLYRRRWMQEGPGCNTEIEAASAFPGQSLPCRCGCLRSSSTAPSATPWGNQDAWRVDVGFSFM